MPRSLDFAPGTPEAMAHAAMRLLHGGKNRVCIRSWSPLGQAVAAELRRLVPGTTFVRDDSCPADKDACSQAVPEARPDLTILAEESGEALSMLLIEYLEVADVRILAPITERHFQSIPLLLISIPKAGTHLLFELVKAFGYDMGTAIATTYKPGHWYTCDGCDTHTEAKDFFHKTVRHSPFRHQYCPFPTAPTIFIYRNPLDILVSESNYYHKRGNAAYSAMLAGMTQEQRLWRLFADPWLMGSLRERVSSYAAWLDMPNVIPVSFEELVGARGGGDDCVQENLIWSMQLKLQVPGDPHTFGKIIYNTTSQTFCKGKIGRYQHEIPESLFQEFLKTPQDYMQIFGFSGITRQQNVFPPRRSDEFRRRPLQLLEDIKNGFPITLEASPYGYNVIYFNNAFYAVPQALGNVTIQDLSPAVLASLPNAETLEELNLLLTAGEDYVARAKLLAVREAPDAFRKMLTGITVNSRVSTDTLQHIESRTGFSIIRQHGFFFVVRQALGPVDLSLPFMTLRSMYSSQDLLWLTSVDQARMAIDLLVSQEAVAVLLQEVRDIKQAMGIVPKKWLDAQDAGPQRLLVSNGTSSTRFMQILKKIVRFLR